MAPSAAGVPRTNRTSQIAGCGPLVRGGSRVSIWDRRRAEIDRPLRWIVALYFVLATTPGATASLYLDAAAVTVSGQVLDLRFGGPIAGAQVSLDQGKPVETDAQGRFSIDGVAGGVHILTASAPGYLTGAYGQRSALGPSLMLQVHARDLVGVTLRLYRFATAEGAVSDEADRPVVGATVIPYRETASGGRLRWRAGREVRTDSRGVYKLPELIPGRYVLYVRPPQQAERLLPVFVGGSYSYLGATQFALSAGDQLQGLVTQLSGGPAFAVGGRLLNVEPRADTRLELRSKTNPAEQIDLVIKTVPVASDGTFSFGSLPAGVYSVRTAIIPLPTIDHAFQQGDGIRLAGRGARPGSALLPLPPGETMWVDETLEVLDKAISVELVPRVAGRFFGRVVSSGSALPKPDVLLSVPVLAAAADGRDLGTIPVARVESDGTFKTAGIPPGPYVIHPRVERIGWSVESVSAAGVDMTGRAVTLGMADQELRIVVTDKPATLSGVVLDARGSATAEAFVIVFPSEPDKWLDIGPLPLRLRDALPNEHGRFQISHLPPGRYLVAALDVAPPETWRTADFLRGLRQSASSVLIGPNEQVTLNLVAR
jgi:hypothetical protein